MKKIFGIAALTFALVGAAPAPAPQVKLWRLDCGAVQVNFLNAFSDTQSYPGKTKKLASSCYLIRHGDTYMLWDTGLPAAMKGQALSTTGPMSATISRTITEQLADLGIKPEQIGFVGVSHYHFDHTGQAASFPGATLLIGAGDWDAVTAKPPLFGADPAPLAPWVDGKSKADSVTGDRDVFGDGSVTMLNLPGHTPGHHGLLVRLAKTGPVLLTGDLAHFAENYAENGVPMFNVDRANTLASFDRFKRLAASLKAMVIIQHEQADVKKLPVFPVAAE